MPLDNTPPHGVGVPKLLEQLSVLVESAVTLHYAPPPAGEGIRWRVYEGSPTTTAPIGEGKTVYAALQTAFEAVVDKTFRGDG